MRKATGKVRRRGMRTRWGGLVQGFKIDWKRLMRGMSAKNAVSKDYVQSTFRGAKVLGSAHNGECERQSSFCPRNSVSTAREPCAFCCRGEVCSSDTSSRPIIFRIYNPDFTHDSLYRCIDDTERHSTQFELRLCNACIVSHTRLHKGTISSSMHTHSFTLVHVCIVSSKLSLHTSMFATHSRGSSR